MGFREPTKKRELHVGESNPRRLGDRQKCYQLHQHGPVNRRKIRNIAFTIRSPVPGRRTTQKHQSHHSIIPWWIYRIPSELRSQAPLGLISTAVGDHAGILGVECFFSLLYVWRLFVCFFFWQMAIFFFLPEMPFLGAKPKLCRTHLPTWKEKKRNKPANRG